jgi:tetratricopeptide (TPR) repeat protein
VRLDDHDADVPSRIAEIYAQREKLSEARLWYMESLHIDAFNPATHAALAQVLMRMNETAEAAREYEVLCELEPAVAGHFADAASAHHKLGDLPKAREFARKAVDLDPDSPAKSFLD